MTAAHENKEKVYKIAQSYKTGINIDQIARLLNGELTVPYLVAQLIIEMGIKSVFGSVTSPIYYVAVENIKSLFFK